MPRTAVNRLFSEMVTAHGKGVTAADVLTLVHQFRVSAEAIFRRLEELKRLPARIWDSLRANRYQPDKAQTTLGLPLTARQPVLPFRYRMMARNAYDEILDRIEPEINLEFELLIDYSALLGARDGEAMCFALAESRGHPIAIDDERPIRRAKKRNPNFRHPEGGDSNQSRRESPLQGRAGDLVSRSRQLLPAPRR